MVEQTEQDGSQPITYRWTGADGQEHEYTTTNLTGEPELPDNFANLMYGRGFGNDAKGFFDYVESGNIQFGNDSLRQRYSDMVQQVRTGDKTLYDVAEFLRNPENRARSVLREFAQNSNDEFNTTDIEKGLIDANRTPKPIVPEEQDFYEPSSITAEAHRESPSQTSKPGTADLGSSGLPDHGAHWRINDSLSVDQFAEEVVLTGQVSNYSNFTQAHAGNLFQNVISSASETGVSYSVLTNERRYRDNTLGIDKVDQREVGFERIPLGEVGDKRLREVYGIDPATFNRNNVTRQTEYESISANAAIGPKIQTERTVYLIPNELEVRQQVQEKYSQIKDKLVQLPAHVTGATNDPGTVTYYDQKNPKQNIKQEKFAETTNGTEIADGTNVSPSIGKQIERGRREL